MLKRIPGILLVCVLLLSLVQCAKKGMPEGGPIDEDPPKFLHASPENYNTNFKREEIRIFFDEYLKLDNPRQQIIISPPINPRPSILPLGSPRRDIRIQNLDSLQPNTTYTINFGKSIVDNNEGNPLPYFKYVFSTGAYLDSLKITGSVSDARLKAPAEFISVFLYQVDSAYTDSVVYKKDPFYVTYTPDSSVNFELENLKAGTYKLVAIEDNNDNYRYNPKSEKIGFVADPISIPTDSTYHLTLFKEELTFTPARPKLFKGQQIIFGYEGFVNPDSVEIRLLNPTPEGFDSRLVKDPQTDTLYYWYKPKLEIDSLSFEVRSPGTRDTLFAKIANPERDSLKITAEPAGTIELNQDFRLRANTPLVESNEEFIRIIDQDSVEVAFSTVLELRKNQLRIIFDKTESNRYQFRALPGAVTDMFGKTNDTIRQNLSTRSLADYGNVVIRLQNRRDRNLIAQLTDLEGKVIAEFPPNSSGSIEFPYVRPGRYLVRVIIDENANNKWDTGNFLEKRQPEPIQYFRDTLEVRANWDVSESFNLD